MTLKDLCLGQRVRYISALIQLGRESMDTDRARDVERRAIRRDRRTPATVIRHDLSLLSSRHEDKMAEWSSADRGVRNDRSVVLLVGHADIARRHLKVGLADLEELLGDVDSGRSAGALSKRSVVAWTQRRGRRRSNGYRIGQQPRAGNRTLELVGEGPTIGSLSH